MIGGVFPVKYRIVIAEHITNAASVQCPRSILNHIVVDIDGNRLSKADIADNAVKADAGSMAEHGVRRDRCRNLIQWQVFLPGDHLGVIDCLSPSHADDALKMRQLIDVGHNLIIFQSFDKVYDTVLVKFIFEQIPDIFHCYNQIGPLYDVLQFTNKITPENRTKHICHDLTSCIFKYYLIIHLKYSRFDNLCQQLIVKKNMKKEPAGSFPLQIISCSSHFLLHSLKLYFYFVPVMISCFSSNS